MAQIDTAAFQSELVIVARVLIGALLGFVIGLERGWRGKEAGDRTFSLVALGATGFTAVGVELFPASAEKVMAGVATGIGFLGVGIIWREQGGQSKGLTTAAANWAVAALGVMAGAGLLLAAGAGALLCLLVLELDYLPFIGRFFRSVDNPTTVAPEASPARRPRRSWRE